MKKANKLAIVSANTLGILALAVPMITAAQETPTPRPSAAIIRETNLNRNRDIRNETLKQRAIAPTAARTMMVTTSPNSATMMLRAEIMTEQHSGPLWLSASSTAPASRALSSTTLRLLRKAAERQASTTLPSDHQDWKKVRLDMFVSMQARLLAETQKSLINLKELRAKIADRIEVASQDGRDMTEPTRLLAIADQKIDAAQTAINAVAAITPSFDYDKEIEVSTPVSLEGPRRIGSQAIDALTDARKALNDIVVAIAQAMGLGQDKASTTTQQ